MKEKVQSSHDEEEKIENAVRSAMERLDEFPNLTTKIRNGKLGNDTAWEESQPLFEQLFPDYPELDLQSRDVIKTAFNIRRSSYVSVLRDERAEKFVSSELRVAFNKLDATRQQDIAPVIKFITNFFQSQVTPFRRR